MKTDRVCIFFKEIYSALRYYERRLQRILLSTNEVFRRHIYQIPQAENYCMLD